MNDLGNEGIVSSPSQSIHTFYKPKTRRQFPCSCSTHLSQSPLYTSIAFIITITTFFLPPFSYFLDRLGEFQWSPLLLPPPPAVIPAMAHSIRSKRGSHSTRKSRKADSSPLLRPSPMSPLPFHFFLRLIHWPPFLIFQFGFFIFGISVVCVCMCLFKPRVVGYFVGMNHDFLLCFI